MINVNLENWHLYIAVVCTLIFRYMFPSGKPSSYFMRMLSMIWSNMAVWQRRFCSACFGAQLFPITRCEFVTSKFVIGRNCEPGLRLHTPPHPYHFMGLCNAYTGTGHVWWLLKMYVCIKTYLATSNGELLIVKKHCEKWYLCSN